MQYNLVQELENDPSVKEWEKNPFICGILDCSCKPYNSYSELMKAEPVDYRKILERKRSNRANETKGTVAKATSIALVASMVMGVFEPTTAKAAEVLPELPVQQEESNLEKNSSINDLIFYGKVLAIERQQEAEKLMAEVVKAEQEGRERAEKFSSTMQEMTIESNLSVKLSKISDKLDELSGLVENPAEAKILEEKISSRIEKLKRDLKECPNQFESLKKALKSEQKRLKKYIKARKAYEKALEARRQEIATLKSFYNNFSRYSQVSQNLGISKEMFREIMASIPYGSSTVFRNNADFMWELAKEFNINEFALPGIFAWESGWADDPIEANNFSSQRRQDGSYFSYDTQEKGIIALATNLANNYLSENGKYYNGKSLEGINVLYCKPDPNHEWAKGVSACMKMIAREYLATVE